MKDHQHPKEFFKARAEKGNRRAFLEFLESEPGESPREGDELPKPASAMTLRSGSNAE